MFKEFRESIKTSTAPAREALAGLQDNPHLAKITNVYPPEQRTDRALPGELELFHDAEIDKVGAAISRLLKRPVEIKSENLIPDPVNPFVKTLLLDITVEEAKVLKAKAASPLVRSYCEEPQRDAGLNLVR